MGIAGSSSQTGGTIYRGRDPQAKTKAMNAPTEGTTDERYFRCMELRSFTLVRSTLLCLTLLGLHSATTGCADAASPSSEIEAAQPGAAIARDVSVTELKAMLGDRPDILLIDVRTDKEWEDGHLPGAAFLDFLEDDFESIAFTLPKDRPIALYCAAGGRSEDAMKRMAKAGFSELYNLRGGFYDWEDAGETVSNDPPVALPIGE